MQVQPAEGAARERFARKALDERAAAAAEENAHVAPDSVTGDAPAPQLRNELEDCADATAVVRCGFLALLYVRVRRGRADKGEVALKRARVDSRATRMGQRLGPRVGRLLGGALFWAGVLCETGTEALEELIDGELEAQAEAAAQEPLK